MAAFSASDLAFEGFRITRERPLWVLGWAVLLTLLQLASMYLLFSMAGSAMADLQSASNSAPQDPTAFLEAYQRLAPAYSLLLPISLLIQTVVTCSIYRAVLRPDERGVLGLRLGGDELRVLVVSIALILLFMVILFVGIMVVGLVAGGVGAASGSGAAGGWTAFAVGLVVMAALAFFAVRMSLAVPMTFEQRDFRIFESWRATQGRFWPLLGAYVLAFILGLLTTLLLGIVAAAIGVVLVLATGGQIQGALADMQDPTRIMQAALPVVILYGVANGVINALFTAIIVAPAAAAWRQLSGTAQVFA